jgi:hypothetical protein
MNEQPYTDEFTVHPVSSPEARLRGSAVDGAVVVLVRHADATAGTRLTANEARVLANALGAIAGRLEAGR